MPIIKSAKKRVRVARKATVRNAKTRRTLKRAVKTFVSSPSAKALSLAQSEIDKAAKKNVIHKNKAARLKRRAAVVGKSAGVKPASAKAKASKSAAGAKKSSTVKPTVKKSATKKPASKTTKKAS